MPDQELADNPMFQDGAKLADTDNSTSQGAPELPTAVVDEALLQTKKRTAIDAKRTRDEIGEPIVWIHPQTKVPIELNKFVLRYQKMWAALRQAEGGSELGEVVIVMYLLTHDMRHCVKLFRESMWADVEIDPDTGKDMTPEVLLQKVKENPNYIPLYKRRYISIPLLEAIEDWGDETFLQSTDLRGESGAKACYNRVFNRISVAKAVPLASDQKDGEEEDDDDSKAKN